MHCVVNNHAQNVELRYILQMLCVIITVSHSVICTVLCTNLLFTGSVHQIGDHQVEKYNSSFIQTIQTQK